MQQRKPFDPALLVSAGFRKPRITLHVYSHDELVTLPALRGEQAITGVGRMYRCTKTGHIRRWGFDEPRARAHGDN